MAALRAASVQDRTPRKLDRPVAGAVETGRQCERFEVSLPPAFVLERDRPEFWSMAAMEHVALRRLVAGQRPSSLNASGLIGDGRSSTLLGHCAIHEPDIQVRLTRNGSAT